MYLYFCDTWTQDKKYEPLIGKIQARLGVLGITGKQERRSIFVDLKRSFKEAVERGVHTIVAVGDDQTLVTAVNIVAPLGVTLGFIPLSSNSQFARVFDLPIGADACDVIAKRLCVSLDVGRIGEVSFIGSARLAQPAALTIETPQKCTIRSDQPQDARVECLGDICTSHELLQTDHPGLLCVTGETEPPKKGLFSFGSRTENEEGHLTRLLLKEAQIYTTSGVPAAWTIDQQWSVPLPTRISVEPNALKMIVGRNRKTETH